jgi:carboxypeptidase D
VPFDIGEMYSGNIPIDTNNKSRNLFFVFYPKLGDTVDEVTIWLNGGPGCSSLEGFFQENGPFVWQPGTLAPIQNPYSWVNLTNMLWVEQPVGTGFSQGEVTATSQLDIAADFVKFFKNFQTIFGIKNFKIYVTGESYAGRYVPYISAAFLDQNDTTYYDLNGALVYDPCIGEFVSIQEEYVAVPFLAENNNILNINDTFLAELEHLHDTCGYAKYLDQYFTFPASGVQPPLYFNYTAEGDCDVFDLINNALLAVNPCFDIYEIVEQCPILSDPLGFPTELVDQVYSTNYFNRTDVKAAMHAPQDVSWSECSVEPVFVGDGGPQGEGDLSPDPIQHILPQVIEATNRVLVGNGDFDMIIITNGTLLAIQNMTWNGQLGFSTRPSTPINITQTDLIYASLYNDTDNGLYYAGLDGPQGIMGVQHYERGLMFVETYQSGHMQPEFQPRVSYRHLEWLLNLTQTI